MKIEQLASKWIIKNCIEGVKQYCRPGFKHISKFFSFHSLKKFDFDLDPESDPELP